MIEDGPRTFTGPVRFLKYIKGPDHWHYVGDTDEPAFENSWVNHGLGNQPARFIKDVSGVVHIQGTVKNAAPGGVIFTLPPGYRPDDYLLLSVSGKTGLAGKIGIEDDDGAADDGSVYYIYGTTAGFAFGISCSFYVG